MKDPEEKEMMAYAAGLIDGDGHIGIRKVGNDFFPLIQLHNSIKEMPRYMKNIFGGTLACDKPKREGYKPIWKWMLQGKEGSLRAIDLMIDHLVIKQDSALALRKALKSGTLNESQYNECKNLNLNRKIEDCNLVSIQRQTSDKSFIWAYIAGIMDTDGSFTIERSVRKPGKDQQKNDLIKYRPRISLSMVTDRAIRFIATHYSNGSLYTIKAKDALRGKAFRWGISSRGDAIDFLKRCLPFLQCKSRQAGNLLNFCRHYVPTNGLAKIPEDEMLWREESYKEIVRLNNTPSLHGA